MYYLTNTCPHSAKWNISCGSLALDYHIPRNRIDVIPLFLFCSAVGYTEHNGKYCQGMNDQTFGAQDVKSKEECMEKCMEWVNYTETEACLACPRKLVR